MPACISYDKMKLDAFCRKRKVRELALFGSVLRDDSRSDSDVDVLVTFEPNDPWSLWDWPAMMDELIALDISTPCPAPTLAVQIAFNGKVSKELTDFADAVRSSGGTVEVRGVRERPIWDRMDIVPATELIRDTIVWLNTRHAS